MPPQRSAAGAAAGATVLLLLLMAGTAGVQAPQPTTRRVPHTVSDLAEICAIPPESPEFSAASFFCRGFLPGAGEYHGALHPAGGPRPPLFCAPDPPPTLLSATNAFVAWARANPQHGGEAAVDGLMHFAVQTYPCPPQERPAGRRRAG